MLITQISFGQDFFFDSFTSAIVISALNLILPFIFALVAKIERYKTNSGEVTATLLRSV